MYQTKDSGQGLYLNFLHCLKPKCILQFSTTCTCYMYLGLTRNNKNINLIAESTISSTTHNNQVCFTKTFIHFSANLIYSFLIKLQVSYKPDLLKRQTKRQYFDML